MANTKVTSNVLADDAVTIGKIHTQSDSGGTLGNQDPNDGYALVAKANSNGYHLSWESVGVSGISSSADATAITIDSSERVSIGHTTANADFQVSNAGAEQIEFYAGNASNVNTIQHYNRSTSSYIENRSIANNHTWYNGGTEVARIHTDGNFGIKVTAPSEALHIEGNTTAGGNNYIHLRKSDQASNQGIYIGQATNNNDLNILQRANNAIVFKTTTSETERLKIDETGRIRINQAASYDCGKLIIYGGSSSGTNGGTLHYNGTSRQYVNCVSSHTAASGHRWWNVKTNIMATDYVMYVARVHGYGYGNSGATVDIYRSGYAHSSTGTFAGQSTKNNGSSSDTLVAYYSSDEYVCFKHEMPSSGYYTGLAFDIAMYSPTGYNFDFEVLGNAWSTTSSNYY